MVRQILLSHVSNSLVSGLQCQQGVWLCLCEVDRHWLWSVVHGNSHSLMTWKTGLDFFLRANWPFHWTNLWPDSWEIKSFLLRMKHHKAVFRICSDGLIVRAETASISKLVSWGCFARKDKCSLKLERVIAFMANGELGRLPSCFFMITRNQKTVFQVSGEKTLPARGKRQN